MNFLTKMACLLLATFYFAGCTRSTPNSGNIKVRIIKDDGKGNYGFQTVELKSVKDLQGMVGEYAVIRYGGSIYCDDSPCPDPNKSIQDNHAPNAKFIDNGEYLIPADYKTLIMTSAMYHFEAIKEMFDRFQGNQGVTFPAVVNVDVKLIVEGLFGPVSETNNAYYYPGWDSFLLIPYENDEGITFPLNGGVLAHEYSHRVFSGRLRKQIALKMGGVLPSIMANYHAASRGADKPLSPSSDEWNFSDVLLGGFDEGIADYFAYVYSGNANFMEPSFKNMKTSSDRNLATEKVFLYSETRLDEEFKNFKKNKVTVMKGYLEVHNIGSVVAHYLWRVSNEKGHEATQKMIIESYDKIAESVASRLRTKSRAQFKDILVPLVQSFPVSETLCKDTKAVFPLIMNDDDAPCKSLKKDSKENTNSGENTIASREAISKESIAPVSRVKRKGVL